MPLEYALQREGLPINAWTAPPERKLPVSPSTVVGLDSIPSQVVRAARKKGYTLNIMVAGESGLGKSTFLNTLFGEQLLPPQETTLAERSTKAIRTSTFNLSENGVDLKVTAIDTPGFGVTLDRKTGLTPVMEYVDAQLANTVAMEERKSFRNTPTDTLVHVCLYFISPSGHSLSELDVLAMRSLSEKVNLIPVIGKADTLTREELGSFRSRLMQQIKAADIKTYPQAHTFIAETNVAEYEKFMPFAVVGSNTTLKTTDGRTVRARQYRWGIVEVENPDHSDFSRLRELIIRSNLNDLVEVTHNVHYERFRSTRLESEGRADTMLQSDNDFNERLEKERAEFAAEMQAREEKMKKLFEKKMLEKDEELKQKENDLVNKRQERMNEVEAEKKRLAAEIAEADRKLNTSGASLGDAESEKKKKGGLLAGSSLLRSKKP